MATERDYFLGTHDEELLRLGLQHRVWRPTMLECWQRAGIADGLRVLDVGAGPGFATADLAEIVGPAGSVTAVERSARFVEAGRRLMVSRGYAHVRWHEIDLMNDALPGGDYDASWCRWVACFVSSPSLLVDRIAAAIRPGGIAIFHEYVQYASFSHVPPRPRQQEFARQVVKGWRATGGEPDVAASVMRLLEARGFVIRDRIARVFCIRPGDEMWQWPASFVKLHLDQQTALGSIEAAWAESVRREWAEAEADLATLLVTPMVLEIVAEKRSDP
jgi:protein-L-isoaspartate O-methyltransferase